LARGTTCFLIIDTVKRLPLVVEIRALVICPLYDQPSALAHLENL
jgi:hypothetical protein